MFQLSTRILDRVADHRSLPRIPTSWIVKAVLVVYWSRLGSLNALEMTGTAKFWKVWLGGPLCSADSVGVSLPAWRPPRCDEGSITSMNA